MKVPKLDITGWLIVGACGAVLFVGAGLTRPTFLGLQFDPFGMDARAIRKQTERANTAESDAAARRLEAGGEREQAQRVETFHTQVVEVRDFTARADTEARSAPNATDPLAADLAARFHTADRFLCNRRPAACPAAPPVDPGRGGADLPAGRAAGEPDPG